MKVRGLQVHGAADDRGVAGAAGGGQPGRRRGRRRRPRQALARARHVRADPRRRRRRRPAARRQAARSTARACGFTRARRRFSAASSTVGPVPARARRAGGRARPDARVRAAAARSAGRPDARRSLHPARYSPPLTIAGGRDPRSAAAAVRDPHAAALERCRRLDVDPAAGAARRRACGRRRDDRRGQVDRACRVAALVWAFLLW